MLKEDLVKRVEEITKAAEQAIANYNVLVGRLNEARFILEEFHKGEVAKSYIDSPENPTRQEDMECKSYGQ